MRFLFTLLTTVALLTPTLATPIYNPDTNGLHRMKPLHIRKIDEHGHVTYIHDQSDHRPDFCSIPGEEELCRLQIEDANAAPPVYDDGKPTSSFEPSELNPEAAHPYSVPEHVQDVNGDRVHNDIVVTLDNGEQVTIHNEPHQRNIRDPEPDQPFPDEQHTPNIQHGLRHAMNKMDIDESSFVQQVHPRNIRPDAGIIEEPAADTTHPTPIADDFGPPATVPHQRNIRDENTPQENLLKRESGESVHAVKTLDVTPAPDDVGPPAETRIGSFGPHTILAERRKIKMLQETIHAIA